MSIDKDDMIKNMGESLYDVRISQNTADVLTQQYMSLLDIDKTWAAVYAAEVESRITGAYSRILAKYKEAMSEEDYEDSKEYLETVHVPTYVERNAQDIISSFDEIFRGDFAASDVEHGYYKPLEGNAVTATQRLDYQSRETKWNLQERVNNDIAAYERQAVNDVNSGSQQAQSKQFDNQTAKKQGFFTRIKNRAKSGISRIASGIKRLFGRG